MTKPLVLFVLMNYSDTRFFCGYELSQPNVWFGLVLWNIDHSKSLNTKLAKFPNDPKKLIFEHKNNYFLNRTTDHWLLTCLLGPDLHIVQQ